MNHFAWLLRARSIRIVSLIVSPFKSTTLPHGAIIPGSNLNDYSADSSTQEGLQRHSDMSNMVVVTENKALRHIPARTGPLVLDGSGRSLTSGIKNQEMYVFWVKRVFIMYSTKLKQ